MAAVEKTAFWVVVAECEEVNMTGASSLATWATAVVVVIVGLSKEEEIAVMGTTVSGATVAAVVETVAAAMKVAEEKLEVRLASPLAEEGSEEGWQ